MESSSNFFFFFFFFFSARGFDYLVLSSGSDDPAYNPSPVRGLHKVCSLLSSGLTRLLYLSYCKKLCRGSR